MNEKELQDLKVELEVYKSVDAALVLNPKCKYIFQPNVGDMPKEQVMSFVTKFKQILLDGLHLTEGSFIIVPRHDELGKIDMIALENEVISYDQNA